MIAFSYPRLSPSEQGLGVTERRQVDKTEAWAKIKGVCPTP